MLANFLNDLKKEEDIINFVVQKYGVDRDKLFKKGRGNAYLSEARQLIAFLLMNNLHYKTRQVEKIINRSHSTVVYAKKIILFRISFNQLLINLVGEGPYMP